MKVTKTISNIMLVLLIPIAIGGVIVFNHQVLSMIYKTGSYIFSLGFRIAPEPSVYFVFLIGVMYLSGEIIGVAMLIDLFLGNTEDT